MDVGIWRPGVLLLCEVALQNPTHDRNEGVLHLKKYPWLQQSESPWPSRPPYWPGQRTRCARPWLRLWRYLAPSHSEAPLLQDLHWSHLPLIQPGFVLFSFRHITLPTVILTKDLAQRPLGQTPPQFSWHGNTLHPLGKELQIQRRIPKFLKR